MLEAVLFDGSSSTDPDGNDTITEYLWTFGDSTAGGRGRIIQHVYFSDGNHPVTLRVADAGGLTNTDQTTCTVERTSAIGRFTNTIALQQSPFDATRLVAFAQFTVLPPDHVLFRPVLEATLVSPLGTRNLIGPTEREFLREYPAIAGTWILTVDYFFVDVNDPNARIKVDSRTTIYTVLATQPPRTPVVRGQDELWWWRGGFGDSWHPTSTSLRSTETGHGCTWTASEGAFKVSLQPRGVDGCEVTVTAQGSSSFRGDVAIRVEVDGQLSQPFRITIFTPYRLLPTGTADAPYDGGYRTWEAYYIQDQFGGIVSGVRIDEQFGSSGTNYAGTVNWRLPTPLGATVSGVFEDVISIWGSGPPWQPDPVGPSDPLAGLPVRYIQMEWFVSTTGSSFGRVRVQQNTQQWYLGFGRHTNRLSPTP